MTSHRNTMPRQASGMASAEYLLMFLVLAITLGILFLVVFRVQLIRDIIDKALIVALVTGVLGAMAWTVKSMIDSANNRARLAIMELMSDEQGRTKVEVAKTLGKLKYGLIYEDALGRLLDEGKLVVRHGVFMLPKVDKEKRTNHT